MSTQATWLINSLSIQGWIYAPFLTTCLLILAARVGTETICELFLHWPWWRTTNMPSICQVWIGTSAAVHLCPHRCYDKDYKEDHSQLTNLYFTGKLPLKSLRIVAQKNIVASQGLAALDMALCIALYCGSAWSVQSQSGFSVFLQSAGLEKIVCDISLQF